MCSTDLLQRLNKIAYFKTKPFCYSCYKVAPTGVCKSCHTDDLMLLLPDSGCEFGTSWVITELTDESLTPVNESELFEQLIDDSYGEEVQVGFMKLSTSQVMKDQDPVSWEIAQGEYIDGLVQDEELISFDNENTYFWKRDVENYIEEVELEMEEAA